MIKKIVTLLMAGAVSVSLVACAAGGTGGTGTESAAATESAVSTQTDLSEASPESAEAEDFPADFEGEGLDIDQSVDVSNLSMYVNMIPEAHNSYPYMGLDFDLPEPFLAAVRENAVFMCPDTDLDILRYGSETEAPKANVRSLWIDFSYVPEAVRSETPCYTSSTIMTNDEYDAWLAKTSPMARLAVTAKSSFDETKFEADGYAEHEIIGEEGGYVFTWSSNPVPSGADAAERELFEDLPAIRSSIAIAAPREIDMEFANFVEPPLGETDADLPDEAGTEGNSGVSFSAATLDGQEVSEDIFADADLTLVNLWATWCSPCLQELPGLESLSKQMADRKVQVVGIVYDTADLASGAQDADAVSAANKITEKLGLTFPNLVPTQELIDQMVPRLSAFPTSVFVDADGNMVGSPVVGARSEADWADLVEERLQEVSK